jgi:GntR family transcriptional regulator
VKKGSAMNNEVSAPLYMQVQTVLEEKIRKGEWEKNFQLPSERELAKQFNVSTITVKRAVLELVNKGLLYRKRGKGTFVTAEKNEKDLYNLIAFESKNNRQDHPHFLLYSVLEAAGNSVAQKMKIRPETLVYKFSRLKMEEEHPVAIEYSYIYYHLCPEFDVKKTENNLIFHVLKDEYGIQLNRARIYFSSELPDDEVAEILQIDKEVPLFILERYTYTEKEEIIEYSKFIMKQENASYYLDISL